MDYPYMPEKIKKQGKEAIEREAEKEMRILDILATVSSGVAIIAVVMFCVFMVIKVLGV